MPTYICNFHLPSGGRKEKRQALISCFLKETAGTGTGENASRYQYNVETYGEYGIFLKRPTQLNKGFDFTVNIQNLYFKKSRKYSNPSHQDIFDALSYCQAAYPYEYNKIADTITQIYHCNDVELSDIRASFCDYTGANHPIQVILLAIKWLFMEQDCAYWNYSGRKMFFEALRENRLV